MPGRDVADPRHHLKRCAKPIFVRALKGLAFVLQNVFALPFVSGGLSGNRHGERKKVVQEEVTEADSQCSEPVSDQSLILEILWLDRATTVGSGSLRGFIDQGTDLHVDGFE